MSGVPVAAVKYSDRSGVVFGRQGAEELDETAFIVDLASCQSMQANLMLDRAPTFNSGLDAIVESFDFDW